MKSVAIIRFSPTEGPGYLASALDAAAIPWQLIRIDAGDALPLSCNVYSGIAMMGGPMSVNDPLGWGAEGAVAARAMDVTDPDVGIQCRFSFEVLFWGLLILPMLALFTDLPIKSLIYSTLSEGRAMIWIALAAACHAYCYTSFYKSFSLIGVGRGEAVGNLYAVFALIFIAAFTLQLPPWYFLVGLVLTVFGSFVMFSETAESVAQLREVEPVGKQA
jgi:hypothetical protein